MISSTEKISFKMVFMAMSFVTIIVISISVMRHSGEGTPSEAGTVRIVAAPTSTGQQPAPAMSPVTSPMTPPTLEKSEVAKRIGGAVALDDVQATCDGATCTVTATPPISSAGFDRQSFERLVNHDLVTAIIVAGYELAEPVQIEEVGAESYRLRFTLRLGRR